MRQKDGIVSKLLHRPLGPIVVQHILISYFSTILMQHLALIWGSLMGSFPIRAECSMKISNSTNIEISVQLSFLGL